MNLIFVNARWLFVPLVFLLLATNAQAQNRTVKVTVSVMKGNEAVVGANVTFTPDTGAPAVQTKTVEGGDAVASVPIGPAGWFSSSATIKITAEKDSQTASETIKLRGKDFSAGAVPEVARTLTLSPPVGAPGEKTVELLVKVVDEEGHAVSMARVNIYQGFFSGTIVVPPMFQDDTSAQGFTKYFKIPVARGQALDLSIEVGREDLQSEVRPINKGTEFATRMLEEFTLKPRPKVGGTGDKKVITVAVDVQNEKFDFVEGARVIIRDPYLGAGSGVFSGVTNAQGRATIPVWWASAGSEQAFGLEVSKEGYKDKRTTIQLNEQQVGKTIRCDGVTLEMVGAGTIKTTVTVLNKKTGQGVGDAKVVLDGGGGSYYSDKTVGGSVTFYVSKPGGFTVQISQDNYFPFTGEARLLKDQPEVPLEFKLEPKANKDKGEDTIEVTVLGKDSTDEKSKPAPIKGAYVKAGTISAETDESGVATLTAAFAENQEVTVQANGYKTKTQDVRVNKILHLSAGSGKATFTLEPELSDNSPIKLSVEVRDESGKPMPKAHVDIETAGGEYLTGAPADDSGNFNFNSSEFEQDISVLRKGLVVGVKAGGYKEVGHRSVPADMLKPSTKTGEFIVQLDRDWTDFSNELAALEEKVSTWKNDRNAGLSKTAESEFIDKALTLRKHAQQLLKEIEAAKETFGISTTPGGVDLKRCRRATELKQDIQLCDAEANQKAEEVKRLLDAGAATAASCSVDRDVDLIKKNYRDAIKLIAEIGKRNKKAVKDRDELMTLATEGSAAKKLLSEMDGKIAAMGEDKKAADENASKAAAQYAHFNDVQKGLNARRIALYREFFGLKVKYDLDHAAPPSNLQTRVTAIENTLNPRDTVARDVPQKQVPDSVSSAPEIISGLQADAQKFLSRFSASVCEIDTMDEMVDGINKTLTDATFEIGLAADLPKQADDCAKKIAGADNQIEVPDLSTLNDLGAMIQAADRAGMILKPAATSAAPPAGSQRLFGPQNPQAKSKAKRGDPLIIPVYQKLVEKSTPTPTPIAVATPSPPPSPSPDNDEIIVPDVSRFKDPDAMLAGAGPDMVGMLVAVRNAPPPGTTTLYSHQDPPANTKSKRGKPLTIYVYQTLAEARPSPTEEPIATPAPSAGAGTMPSLIGMTIEQASAALPAGARIGSDEIGSRRPKTPEERPLTIYYQYPPASQVVEAGTSVTIRRFGSADSVASTEPSSTPVLHPGDKTGSPTDITNTTGGEFWGGTPAPSPAKRTVARKKSPTPAPKRKKKTSDWWRQHGHDRPDYEVPNN